MGFFTSNQLGRKSVFYSRQVVGKLIFKILSNLGRIIFLKFFRKTLLKMPFSSATTWRSILKNCNRSTHKKFGFGGYHLRRTMDKKRFSPATTWKINNQPFKLWHKTPWKNGAINMLSRGTNLNVSSGGIWRCFPKPVDKSLLNVLTSRGIFFCSRWKLLFEIPNTVRDIQKLDG